MTKKMAEISATAEYQERIEDELRLMALKDLAKAYTKEFSEIGRELYPSLSEVAISE